MTVSSYRKLGAALGVSHMAVVKAEKSGRIEREPDGSWDVERCRASLKLKTHPMLSKEARAKKHATASAPAAKPSHGSREPYHDAITRKEIALANIREIEEAEKRDALVPLAEINAHVAGMIIRARDVLTRMGGELRDSLASETDPIKCEALINAETNQALRELREYTPDG